MRSWLSLPDALLSDVCEVSVLHDVYKEEAYLELSQGLEAHEMRFITNGRKLHMATRKPSGLSILRLMIA